MLMTLKMIIHTAADSVGMMTIIGMIRGIMDGTATARIGTEVRIGGMTRGTILGFMAGIVLGTGIIRGIGQSSITVLTVE